MSEMKHTLASINARLGPAEEKVRELTCRTKCPRHKEDDGREKLKLCKGMKGAGSGMMWVNI